MKFYELVRGQYELEGMIENENEGEWATRDDAEQLEKERDAYKKVARDMEECVDNVREAMGLESTHYLVLHDEVRDMRLKGEQAAKDAVWAAKMIVRHGQHLDEMIIQDAQAIIEQYEGGQG